jgi:hypothetical protein
LLKNDNCFIDSLFKNLLDKLSIICIDFKEAFPEITNNDKNMFFNDPGHYNINGANRITRLIIEPIMSIISED